MGPSATGRGPVFRRIRSRTQRLIFPSWEGISGRFPETGSLVTASSSRESRKLATASAHSNANGTVCALRALLSPSCLEILSLHGCKEADQKPEDAAGKDIDDRVSRSAQYMPLPCGVTARVSFYGSTDWERIGGGRDRRLAQLRRFDPPFRDFRRASD